jgi:hypothetical protein
MMMPLQRSTNVQKVLTAVPSTCGVHIFSMPTIPRLLDALTHRTVFLTGTLLQLRPWCLTRRPSQPAAAATRYDHAYSQMPAIKLCIAKPGDREQECMLPQCTMTTVAIPPLLLSIAATPLICVCVAQALETRQGMLFAPTPAHLGLHQARAACAEGCVPARGECECTARCECS